MAAEARRGCGYRKVGGIYLVADGQGTHCERLPLPIGACSHCGAGVKFTRGFQWIPVARLFDDARPCKAIDSHCPKCVVCTPALFQHAKPTDKVGLIWIGGQHYATPTAFLEEAARMGVSRRVAALPKGLVIGKTYIATAHATALPGLKEGDKPKPGIIHLFRTQRVELIVTPTVRQEDWVKRYEEMGVTLVEVPDGDPDHAPAAKRPTARRAAQARVAEAAREATEFSLFKKPRVRIDE